MKIIRILSFVILLLSLIILAMLQFLPNYLSKEIIPALAKKTGLPSIALAIDKISANSIRFSHLRLGPNNNQAFYIDSGEISYAPAELFHRNLQKLSVSGLQFSVTLAGGKIEVSGVRLPPPEKHGPSPTLSSEELLARFNELPVRLTTLLVKNSRCTVQISGRTIEIPFDLDIRFTNRQIPRFDFAVKLTPFGAPINVNGVVDLVKNSFQADLLADSFSLNKTNLFLGDLPFNISTITKIKGRASGTIFPFSPKYNFSANLDDLTADYQNIKIGPLPSQLKSRPRVAVKMTGDNEQLDAQVSGITILKPITALVDNITLHIGKRASDLSGVGSLSMTIPAIQQNSFSLLSPLNLSSTFNFGVTDGTIKGKSKTIIQAKDHSSSRELTFVKEGHQVQIKPITISISGKRSPRLHELSYKILSPQIRDTTIDKSTKQPSATLQGTSLSLTGEVSEDPWKPNDSRSGEFILAIEELTGKSPYLSAKTAIKIVGKIKQFSHDKGISPNLSATLEINRGELTLQKEKMTLSAMRANIPFSWPMNQKNAREGSFDCRIMVPNHDIGSLSGTIRLEKGSYVVDASLFHKVIPRLTTHIMANLSADTNSLAPRAKISFRLPQYHFDSKEIDLAIFNNLEAAGNVEVHGSLEISKKRISGNYELTLADTTLHLLSQDITVEGLNLDLNIPNIEYFKSGPSVFRFEKATLGNTIFAGGKAIFQLENTEDLLIENSTINWSSGKIHILGTRVTAGVKRQDITLYCERLNLAELLSQLGVANAHGDGKVNGKISLSIENGTFTFSDAFLYSTPGTGGTLQINNSEIILSGVPPTSTQYGQLDFASAALKDFKYQWVTLTLSPNDDNTVIALKLAGKPTMPLPFRYDTSLGTFVRLPDQNKGIDYPINLDVNFHLPLNKILNYGTNLKDIFTK